MSSSTAELTLIIRAQNLAEAELAKVKTNLQGIATTARVVASDVAASFKDIGKRIGRQFGNLAQDILTGGNIVYSLTALGATMAGALVEGLSAHFIPMVLEKVLATQAFAPVAAALAGEGSILGAVLSTAIAVGMAAFPFILAGVAIAALVYLIANPEARQKAHDIAMMILGKIGDGLAALPKLLGDIFSAAMQEVDRITGGMLTTITKGFQVFLSVVTDIVNKIVDVILFIPRAVATAIGALQDLGGTKFQVYPGGNRPPRHAEGGWVGLNGPELGILGEEGPEYVVPNHRLGALSAKGGSMGVTIVGVSEKDIAEVVDRQLYVKLRRASLTSAV